MYEDQPSKDEKYRLLTKLRNIDIEKSIPNIIKIVDEKSFQILEDTDNKNSKNKENQMNYFGHYQPTSSNTLLVPLLERKYKLAATKNQLNESSPMSDLITWQNKHARLIKEHKQLLKQLYLNNIKEYVRRYDIIFDNRKGANYQYDRATQYNHSEILRFIFETKINPPSYQFYSYRQLKVMETLLKLIFDSVTVLKGNGVLKGYNVVSVKYEIQLALIKLRNLMKLDINLLNEDKLQIGLFLNDSMIVTDKSLSRKQLSNRVQIESNLMNPQILDFLVDTL